MHAVVVHATLSDVEKARGALEAEILPRVRAMPGLVAGYWLEPIDGEAMSVVVFESEGAAREASKMVQPGSQPSAYATVDTMEIRAVVGTP